MADTPGEALWPATWSPGDLAGVGRHWHAAFPHPTPPARTYDDLGRRELRELMRTRGLRVLPTDTSESMRFALHGDDAHRGQPVTVALELPPRAGRWALLEDLGW